MRYFVVFLLFISVNIHAQEIKPKGQFLADSIKIGEPVGFALSLKYPKKMDILFPDSLYDFSPYELEKKTYIPTKSDSVYSYDSAVYYLSSFEIDPIQRLKLPVFVLHGNDSTLIHTAEDSVFLKELVEEVPDSISAEAAPLKENTTYIQVPLEFNYPYFIIGTIILVIILVVVYAVFGKKIRSAFILRRLKKKHQKFLAQFEVLVTKQNEPASKLAERILIHWKRYLEKLENRPYTKLTTKEIITAYSPGEIADDLKGLDRAIYSSATGSSLENNYKALKTFAQAQYEHKIEEVKHG